MFNEVKMPQSRKKNRRVEYSRVQGQWKKNRTICLRSLLKNKRNSLVSPKDVMISFWDRIMTHSNSSTSRIDLGVWSTQIFGVRSSPRKFELPFLPKAQRPVGFFARELRNIPVDILVRIFNIFICGRLLHHLLESRTILIPKKDGASNPDEFRLITILSSLTRIFHKVLTNRMSRPIKLDSKQKTFDQLKAAPKMSSCWTLS